MLLASLKPLLNTRIKKIDEKELIQMTEHFIKGAPQTYTKNHYELANETGIAAVKWEEFISLAEVTMYVDEQLALVNAANAKRAILDLGSASSSIDIQKSKQFLEMQKQNKAQEFKPFTVMFLPRETLKYKRSLLKIDKAIEEALATGKEIDLHEIRAYIYESIPPKVKKDN